MRSYLLPALVAGGLALSGAAYAATTTEGVVKAFDIAKHSLTLADGSVYQLPATFTDPGLKVGAKVAVVWDMMGTTHEASKVTIAK
jgi:hypothetical protein